MNPKIIYIGGIKGVGKTTLINSLTPELLDYQIVDVTIQMREYTDLHNRDQLDEITVVDRFKARKYAFPKVLQDTQKNKLIFDSHFCIPSIYGHEWGFPWSFISNVNILILITSKPDIILERLRQDISRNRGRVSLSEVELDIKIEEIYADFIAKTINKPLYIIENNNNVEDSKNTLLKTISEYAL